MNIRRNDQQAAGILSPRVLFGVTLVCLTVSVVNAQSSVTPALRTGAYSEEQAIRGQSLYNSQCWQCHGETLSGQDQSPPLAGPEFTGIWDGEPLWALVTRIDSMPPDKPGSLSRTENVDILTYILWYNGLPIGDKPLGVDQSSLSAMNFQTPPLPGQ